MLRYSNKPRRKPIAKAIDWRLPKRRARMDGAYATLLMLLAAIAVARLCIGTPLLH